MTETFLVDEHNPNISTVYNIDGFIIGTRRKSISKH